MRRWLIPRSNEISCTWCAVFWSKVFLRFANHSVTGYYCFCLSFLFLSTGNIGSPSYIGLYTRCGVNILLVEYRGYGLSDGYPSEQGFYLDGEAAVKYLMNRTDIDHQQIVLYGHSLGGAVATHIAAMDSPWKSNISAVILENTFTSIQQIGAHIFRNVLPFLSKLPAFLVRNRFESADKIMNIKAPILFICGDKDEIVPHHMTIHLSELSTNMLNELAIIPGGSHNDTWCVSDVYYVKISLFLHKIFNTDDSNIASVFPGDFAYASS